MAKAKIFKMPEPQDELGYSRKEIEGICGELRVALKRFWEAFGINTIAIGKDGKGRYYRVDVERALYKLGLSGGEDHLWD